jgi:hypothetical protein
MIEAIRSASTEAPVARRPCDFPITQSRSGTVSDHRTVRGLWRIPRAGIYLDSHRGHAPIDSTARPTERSGTTAGVRDGRELVHRQTCRHSLLQPERVDRPRSAGGHPGSVCIRRAVVRNAACLETATESSFLSPGDGTRAHFVRRTNFDLATKAATAFRFKCNRRM